jgi:hypothetical protein
MKCSTSTIPLRAHDFVALNAVANLPLSLPFEVSDYVAWQGWRVHYPLRCVSGAVYVVFLLSTEKMQVIHQNECNSVSKKYWASWIWGWSQIRGRTSCQMCWWAWEQGSTAKLRNLEGTISSHPSFRRPRSAREAPSREFDSVEISTVQLESKLVGFSCR